MESNQHSPENILFNNISLQEGVSQKRSILGEILKYYSHAEYSPSNSQVEKDRWVFFGLIRTRSWMAIPAGILIQFCYGSVYAWSIFNAPINKELTGDSESGKAEITFYIAIGIFGLTGTIFGPWIDSNHPRKSGIIGLIVFLAGHLTSALAINMRMISLLYFGYGVVAGIGLGIGYLSTVDSVSKWWPKARGTASGCAVMGFGGGSIAFTTISENLIEKVGLSVTFLCLGLIHFIVMLFCVQLISPPPPGYNVDGIPVIEKNDERSRVVHVPNMTSEESDKTHTEFIHEPRYLQVLGDDRPVINISLAETLHSHDFWLLYAAFLANGIFCLVVISNLTSILQNLFGVYGDDNASLPLAPYHAVTIEGVFNMLGRVLIGFLSDIFGRKTVFLIILIIQIVTLSCISIAMHTGSFWVFIVLIWITTICYGGGIGVIPAFLSDMFGINNTSSCHGIFLSAWAISSVCGGVIFTEVVEHYIKNGDDLDDPKKYTVNFMWMLAVVVIGFICCLFVRASIRDRLFPALPNQILRIRVFGRVLRVMWTTDRADFNNTEAGSISHSDQLAQSTRALRCSGFKKQLYFEFLTKEQEQAAWEEYLFLRAIQYRLMNDVGVEQ